MVRVLNPPQIQRSERKDAHEKVGPEEADVAQGKAKAEGAGRRGLERADGAHLPFHWARHRGFPHNVAAPMRGYGGRHRRGVAGGGQSRASSRTWRWSWRA